MRLPELGLLYGVVGLACACVLLKRRGQSAMLDASLVLLFWPIFLPALASNGVHSWRGGISIAPEQAFLSALAEVRATPFRALLPAPDEIARLAERLTRTRAKVTELDALLAAPEWNPDRATRHVEALEARGASGRAVAAARMRLSNVRRLGTLRARYAVELDELIELSAQLRTQVEVLRHAGDAARDLEAIGGMVSELLARVEALDDVLEPAESGKDSEAA
jgi:hypothetical protein